MIVKVVIAAVGGLVSVLFMLLNPIGPGLFMSAVTPFDALFSVLFGLMGNLVTYLPLIVMMVVSSPSVWVEQLLGTRLQIAIFLMMLALSISHFLLATVYPTSGILEYLRKLTLWIVVGVWAWHMRSPDDIRRITRVLVVSTAAYTLISMADFYFGVGALPAADDSVLGVAGATLEDTSSVHTLRYRGGGLPINRTANWLIMPAFAGFGWYMLSKRKTEKSVALLSVVVCVFGIFATVSRSAIGATLFGFLLTLPMTVGANARRVFGATLTIALIAALGLGAMYQLGFLDLIEERFAGDASVGMATKRVGVFLAALRIWMTSPIYGVGDSLMHIHPLYVGVGAHNTFLGILAEAGLIGLIPFIFLTLLIVSRFLRRASFVDPEFDAWRPFFFAGYIASMTMSQFNEYTWERPLWFSIAYLIALERADAFARAARFREMQAEQESWGAAPVRGLEVGQPT